MFELRSAEQKTSWTIGMYRQEGTRGPAIKVEQVRFLNLTICCVWLLHRWNSVTYLPTYVSLARSISYIFLYRLRDKGVERISVQVCKRFCCKIIGKNITFSYIELFDIWLSQKCFFNINCGQFLAKIKHLLQNDVFKILHSKARLQ